MNPASRNLANGLFPVVGGTISIRSLRATARLVIFRRQGNRMRWLAVVCICLAIGCVPTKSPQEDAKDLAPAVTTDPGPGRGSFPPPTGLYTDVEIQKLAKYDIDKESGDGRGIFNVPALDLVPNGETRARSVVFRSLGLSDARIRDFRIDLFNKVIFLSWQVSPSYDICCMMAVGDPDNKGLEFTDPKRKVYGIRFVKRGKQ